MLYSVLIEGCVLPLSFLTIVGILKHAQNCDAGYDEVVFSMQATTDIHTTYFNCNSKSPLSRNTIAEVRSTNDTILNPCFEVEEK